MGSHCPRKQESGEYASDQKPASWPVEESPGKGGKSSPSPEKGTMHMDAMVMVPHVPLDH